MVYPQAHPHPVTQAHARGETRPQVEPVVRRLTRSVRGSFAGHAAVDALEIGEVGEVDRDPCPAWRPSEHSPACRDGRRAAPRARAVREGEGGSTERHRRRRGSAAASTPPVVARTSAPEHRRARRPPRSSRTRPALVDRLAGEVLLQRAIWRAEQRPGVAGGQLAIGEQMLDRGWQSEQAQRVGDRRSALADARRRLLRASGRSRRSAVERRPLPRAG